MEQYLQSISSVKVEVQRDGLCMLHAVYGGLSSQTVTPSEEAIKHKVLHEFLDHVDDYMPYSVLSAENTLAEVENWAKTGRYSSDSADLILHILSQVLDLRLLIAQQSVEGCVDILELLPHRHDENLVVTPFKTVHLIKEGQHFNYAVCFKHEPKWSPSASPIVINSSSEDSDSEYKPTFVKLEPLSPNK